MLIILFLSGRDEPHRYTLYNEMPHMEHNKIVSSHILWLCNQLVSQLYVLCIYICERVEAIIATEILEATFTHVMGLVMEIHAYKHEAMTGDYGILQQAHL